MGRSRTAIDCLLGMVATAILVAVLPGAARADTIDPTLIGPAELTVGQFVAVICCAAVVIAAGIWALVHIRRRRRREPGAATSATSGDADRER